MEEWAADDGSLPGYCEVPVAMVSSRKQFFTRVAHHTMPYEVFDRLYGGESVLHYRRRAGRFTPLVDTQIVRHSPQCQNSIGELLTQASRALEEKDYPQLRKENASAEEVFRNVHVYTIAKTAITFAEMTDGRNPRGEISLYYSQLGKCLLF
jgi:hypothetical protein